MKHLIICLCLLLSLTACQKATTLSPMASEEELAREREIQKELSKQQDSAAPMPKTERAQLMQRVKTVGERVQQASFQLCQEMFSHSGAKCRFDIALSTNEGLNAYADGEKVVIFPDMVEFAKKDEELALVLAHELAHNVMRHPDNQKQNATVGVLLGTLADALAQSQGVNTGGGLSKLGAEGAILAYSTDFEREADYVGLYILARSGYDITPTANFWRRMSAKNPDSIYIGTTHPTNPERYINIQKTVAEIQRKQQQGLPLRPEIRKDS